MRVFILTEGSSNIGFGHITRCTSLYQAFKEKGIIPEFIVNGDETVKALLQGNDCHIFNWIDERERLYSVIKRADAVIIDSYLADPGFYKTVSEIVKIPVYMDDTRRINYPRGLVVNGAVYAEELDYPASKGVRYLLGSRYAPLRKAFWNVPDKEIKEDLESIMITFGGDDTRNMTPKILKLLAEHRPSLAKTVVIGKAFKNLEAIKAVADDKTKLIYYPDAEGMRKIMLESDIAISAGGQTLYELARVGVPAIAIAVAGNQMNNIKGWQRAGFIEYAGWWKDSGIHDTIIRQIELLNDNKLRQKKAKTGMSMVDGSGAMRTMKYCIKKYFEGAIVLRKAEMKDVHNIYELSNAPDVRQNSFSGEDIKLEHHKGWFADKLSDNNCLFLVAEADNEFLGQIRFDVDENRHDAVISISVAGKFRGLEISGIMLQKALNDFEMPNLGVKNIKAFIKEQNVPSIKFFEKAGFQFTRKLIIKDQQAVEYSYRIDKE